MDGHLDVRIYLTREQQLGFRNDLLEYAASRAAQPLDASAAKNVEIIENSVFSGGQNEDDTQKEVVLYCAGCRKGFRSPQSYARHLYAHTFQSAPKSDELYLCNVCAGEFLNRYIHLNNVQTQFYVLFSWRH